MVDYRFFLFYFPCLNLSLSMEAKLSEYQLVAYFWSCHFTSPENLASSSAKFYYLVTRSASTRCPLITSSSYCHVAALSYSHCSLGWCWKVGDLLFDAFVNQRYHPSQSVFMRCKVADIPRPCYCLSWFIRERHWYFGFDDLIAIYFIKYINKAFS